MRTVRRAVIAVILTLIGLELGSFLVLRIAKVMPDKPFSEMYRFSACLKENEYNAGRLAGPRNVSQTLLNKIPHPYFGFTNNTDRMSEENAQLGRASCDSADHFRSPHCYHTVIPTTRSGITPRSD